MRISFPEMTPYIRAYYCLVGASLSAFAVYLLWRGLSIDALDDVERVLVVHDGYGGIFRMSETFWTWATANAASYLGLLLRRWWGAVLMLAVYAVLIVSSPFAGWMIKSPVEAAAGTIMALCDGAVLTLAVTRMVPLR